MNVTGQIVNVRARRELGGMRRDPDGPPHGQTQRRRRHAAGDEAQLYSTARLHSELRGLEQARRDAGNGIAAIQTAERSLGQMGELLARMDDLAHSSEAGGARPETQKQFQAMLSELGRIAKDTNYGEQSLLDGTSAEISFHIGLAPEDQSITIATADLRLEKLGHGALSRQSLSSPVAAARAQEALAVAQEQVSAQRAVFGEARVRLDKTIETLGVAISDLLADEDSLRQAPEARRAAANLARRVRERPQSALRAQANQTQSVAVTLLMR